MNISSVGSFSFSLQNVLIVMKSGFRKAVSHCPVPVICFVYDFIAYASAHI